MQGDSELGTTGWQLSYMQIQRPGWSSVIEWCPVPETPKPQCGRLLPLQLHDRVLFGDPGAGAAGDLAGFDAAAAGFLPPGEGAKVSDGSGSFAKWRVFGFGLARWRGFSGNSARIRARMRGGGGRTGSGRAGTGVVSGGDFRVRSGFGRGRSGD